MIASLHWVPTLGFLPGFVLSGLHTRNHLVPRASEEGAITDILSLQLRNLVLKIVKQVAQITQVKWDRGDFWTPDSAIPKYDFFSLHYEAPSGYLAFSAAASEQLSPCLHYSGLSQGRRKCLFLLTKLSMAQLETVDFRMVAMINLTKWGSKKLICFLLSSRKH